MYNPSNVAPSEFMQRYDAIMDGSEKLDTLAKLQEFWLFALDQGWKHWECRERIAWLTLNATWKWSPYLEELTQSEKHRHNIGEVSMEWSTFDNIGPSPYPNELTDKEFSDRCWNTIATYLDLCDLTKEN